MTTVYTVTEPDGKSYRTFKAEVAEKASRNGSRVTAERVGL